MFSFKQSVDIIKTTAPFFTYSQNHLNDSNIIYIESYVKSFSHLLAHLFTYTSVDEVWIKV